MKEFKPFFINSNLCYDECDIATFDKYMRSIQYNIGNSYITYSLIKELCGGFKKVPHIQNIYYYDFSKVDTDIDFINSECTHCFFIIQDFIRINEFPLPYERLIYMFSKINIPIIVAGIGANAFGGLDSKLHKKLKPIVVKFLQYLSERCVQIGVRGFYTEEVLNNLGIHNVTAMGCPSFYEMGPERKVIKKPLDLTTPGIDILLSSTVTNKYLLNSFQICQDFQETDIIKTVAFNNFDIPLTPEQCEKFFARKYRIFSNIDDWRKFVSQFSFTIGNRVHGSIISLNAGIPAVCRNGDARAAEMCKLLNIPVRLDVNYEADVFKIYDEVDVDAMNDSYPALYENYVEFLHKNGLSIYSSNGKEVYDTQPSLKLYSNVKDDDIWQNLIRLRMSNSKIKKKLIEQDRKLKNIEKIDIVKNKLEHLENTLINTPKISVLEKLFSVKEENQHKVITILGIKCKFRR